MGWVGFEFSVIHINRKSTVFCSAAGGQFDFESRSSTLFAFDSDGAVMIVENSFYDKQSEAGALGIGRAFEALELAKEVRQLSFRNSDAAILDGQRNLACDHPRS
jgi:hypothetical protein